MGEKPTTQKLKAVKSILFTLPPPETDKSPYLDIAAQWGLKIDFRAFTHVEGVEATDFRKSKVYLEEYPAVIITSRNSIEHYFRICEEMRVKISEDTKYFCMSEIIALYLQNFIQYRKRKIFFGDGKPQKLVELITKNKTESKFLLPCSDMRDNALPELLRESKVDFTEATIFRTVASDLSDLSDVKYDVLVFFSPSSVASLYKNFPDFSQGDTRIAAFGTSTIEALKLHDLRIDIPAPSKEAPSMATAIINYLKLSNK